MSSSVPPLFLTDEELAHLTGYKRKSRQIEWLRDQGIPFHVSGSGHPVVTRSSLQDPTLSAVDNGLRWSPRVAAAATIDGGTLPNAPALRELQESRQRARKRRQEV